MKNLLNNGMTNKEIQKYENALHKLKHPCTYCGRKKMIPKFKDKVMCDHCGHYVFKTRREEFIYYLSKRINIRKESEINEKESIKTMGSNYIRHN